MRLRYLDHWTFSASCSICTDGCEGHGAGMKKKRKADGWQMGKQIQHIASLLADNIDGTMCPSIDVQIPSLQSFSFTLRKWAPKGLQYFYQQKRCNCGSKGKISKIERMSQGNTKSLRVSVDWRDWQEKTRVPSMAGRLILYRRRSPHSSDLPRYKCHLWATFITSLMVQ